ETKAKTIISKASAFQGASIDDMLTGLATVAAGELTAVPTTTTAGAGTGAGTPPATGTTPESDNTAALAKAAESGNFSGMTNGGKRFSTFNYKVDDLKPGNTLTVTLLVVLSGRQGATVASFRVTTYAGGVLDGVFVYSSKIVDANGTVVAAPGA